MATPLRHVRSEKSNEFEPVRDIMLVWVLNILLFCF